MSSSPWTAIIDPASGGTYYANAITNEVTWTRPADMPADVVPILPPTAAAESQPSPIAVPQEVDTAAGVSETPIAIIDIPGTAWSKVWDANSRKYYFANRETFAVDWNTPPEVLAAQMAGTTISAQASAVPSRTTSPPAGEIVHEFDRVVDPASGRYYYVSRQTQAVQWDVPESWRIVQEEEARQAAATSSRRGSVHGMSKSVQLPDSTASAVAAAAVAAVNSNRPATMRASAMPPPLPQSRVASAQSSAANSRRTTHEPAAGGMFPTFSPDAQPAQPMERRGSAIRAVPPPLPSTSTPASPYGQQRSAVFGGVGASATDPPLAPNPLHAGSPMGSPGTPARPLGSPAGSPASASSASALAISTVPTPRFAPATVAPMIGPDGKPVLAAAIKADIHNFASKGYASNHFRTFSKRKTGFLSKSVVMDVNEVLSWQKAQIHKSLLQSSKKYSSDAVNVFKKILAFMGDAPDAAASKKNPALLASDILAIGLKIAPLRDEIFCQLCKQTKLNPEPLSCAAGWRLMALACASFAPTRGFQDHLSKYFQENYAVESPPEAAILSRYCQWKMQKTIHDGGDEKLTLAQVEEMGKSGVKSYTVLFPGDLEYIAYCQAMEQNKYQAQYPGVPEIMIQMCDLIRENGGFATKGIFRIAAQREHTNDMRAKVEAGKYDALHAVKNGDCHTPADVLKHWCRELMTPLVPSELYDKALKASENEAECVALVENDLRHLPAHVATMNYLLTFLAELATHHKETLMSEENLAIVWSQDILKTDEKDPVVLYKNSQREKNFVRHLITAWGKRAPASAAAAQ